MVVSSDALPFISVVIATIQGGTVGATIRSIQRQTVSHWELILVAQGSDPVLREVCEQEAKTDDRIQVIHVPEKGVSRARNRGAQAARAEFIAYTDDDCEAQEDWLAVILARFAADPNAGVVSGAVIPPKPSRNAVSRCPECLPEEAVYDPQQDTEPPAGWDWISANVALRRAVFSRVGGFDPLLGGGTAFGAAEDTDYKLRLIGAGVRMIATPTSVVHHTHGRRYGWKAVQALRHNYSAGNAALAAKLTLLGDKRGEEWLARMKQRISPAAWLRHPLKAMIRLDCVRKFCRTYDEVLAQFDADKEQNLLVYRADAQVLVPTRGRSVPHCQYSDGSNAHGRRQTPRRVSGPH